MTCLDQSAPTSAPLRLVPTHGRAPADLGDSAPLTILHMDASARFERSITRGLSTTFVEEWLELRPNDRVVRRDLARNPPPYVTEEWIAASFTSEGKRDDAMRAALSYSDAAIEELIAAHLIVLGVPMYNYGMPAVLKAWFDQVIRVGRTFSFDLARGDWPIKPLLSAKRLVVLSARGEFGFQPHGVREDANHLDRHVATLAGFLGVSRDEIRLIEVEYQEFKDERFVRSLKNAKDEVHALVQQLAADTSLDAAREQGGCSNARI